MGSLGNRLYRGEVSYDFVGRRKRWYAVSALFLLLSVIALLFFRLTLGIEFRGGAEFRVASPEATETAVLETVEDAGIAGEIRVQQVGNDTIRVQTEKLTTEESQEVSAALAERFDVSRDDVSSQLIGPSWGEDISKKAIRALVFFLVLVVVFLSLYFEWKMAVAAMLALLHDLAITVGIYALVGFEVTPATVIGFLTILGYSLYDTVVVFDKVRENTQGLAGGSRMTYSGAANLAVNQTIVRSINTSIVALLPIGAILFAGVVLLGAGPLKDLALALFVGVAAGTYSSIFIATPLLASLKEREPAMQALARRVAARGGGAAKTLTRDRDRGRPRASSRDGAPDELTDEEQPEPATAGAAVRGGPGPRDRRPAGGGARNQPKRKNKSRPGGKKRR
jgi:preprotein translocase subunit SecF